MRPTSEPRHAQRELFQIDLEQLIDLQHPLAVLARRIDWEQFDLLLGSSYHPTQGAPGTPTRLMVALHFLKYQTDLGLPPWLRQTVKTRFAVRWILSLNRLSQKWGQVQCER